MWQFTRQSVVSFSDHVNFIGPVVPMTVTNTLSSMASSQLVISEIHRLRQENRRYDNSMAVNSVILWPCQIRLFCRVHDSHQRHKHSKLNGLNYEHKIICPLYLFIMMTQRFKLIAYLSSYNTILTANSRIFFQTILTVCHIFLSETIPDSEATQFNRNWYKTRSRILTTGMPCPNNPKYSQGTQKISNESYLRRRNSGSAASRR